MESRKLFLPRDYNAKQPSTRVGQIVNLTISFSTHDFPINLYVGHQLMGVRQEFADQTYPSIGRKVSSQISSVALVVYCFRIVKFASQCAG